MSLKLTSTIQPDLDFLTFGQELAKAARNETLARFARGCAVENKASDGSFDPVTEADRAAETAMRDLITHHFPDHGIQGEEFGNRAAKGRYSWSLDPIDGTRSFVCGLPSWVTLVALLDDGEPVAGLIDNPSLDELYVGETGHAFLQQGPLKTLLRTSDCISLADARLSTTDPYLFEENARKAFEQLRCSARTVRWGYDGYAYARLAAGTLDLVVECGLKPHDYNALIPVVRGAGGTFGDWRGGSDFAAGNVVAAANNELYRAAVSIMRDCA